MINFFAESDLCVILVLIHCVLSVCCCFILELGVTLSELPGARIYNRCRAHAMLNFPHFDFFFSQFARSCP
jgi:hypothetical protein